MFDGNDGGECIKFGKESSPANYSLGLFVSNFLMPEIWALRAPSMPPYVILISNKKKNIAETT